MGEADVFPFGRPSYLLTVDNTKALKSRSEGVYTAVLHLSPEKESIPFGGRNMCPWASRGCTIGCLISAGKLRFPESARARIKRTLWFLRDIRSFKRALVAEIVTHRRRAERLGCMLAVRLNGTSDVAWERETVFPALFRIFPDVQFYDYTKSRGRVVSHALGALPVNYHLTYSLSERDGDIETAISLFETGGNVAAVFRTEDSIPDRYMGFPTVPADRHDMTFLWPPGSWLALKAKGKAKRDTSGFVIDL